MATHFDAEAMRKIRQAAGAESVPAEKERETFATVTNEVSVSTETQPISADEMEQRSRHAVALDLAEVRANIAAMDGAMTPAQRVVGPKDAQALDVTAIQEELDRRDAGLSGGWLQRLQDWFRKI